MTSQHIPFSKVAVEMQYSLAHMAYHIVFKTMEAGRVSIVHFDRNMRLQTVHEPGTLVAPTMSLTEEEARALYGLLRQEFEKPKPEPTMDDRKESAKFLIDVVGGLLQVATDLGKRGDL